MSQRVSSIRNLRTIKAIRGDSLKIDLGRSFSKGFLTAWMKKDSNSNTYRSFDIIDNRYLVLGAEKTKDYYTYNDVNVLEEIRGKWYFDVVQTIGLERKTIYTGTILFENDITLNNGAEVINPNLIDINIDGGSAGLISILRIIDGGNSGKNISNLNGGSAEVNFIFLDNIDTNLGRLDSFSISILDGGGV